MSTNETHTIMIRNMPTVVTVTERYNNGHEECVAFRGPEGQRYSATVAQFEVAKAQA